MNARQLREKALSLSPEERANLARELLQSLEEPPQPDLESVWLAEIERRALELADGSVTPVDWEIARERIARRLHERSS